MKPGDITTVLSTPRLGADGRYHFLYVTWDPDTDEWYGGKHSTDDLDDWYRGSSDWVKKHPAPDRLVTTPIAFFKTEAEAYAAEMAWITFEAINGDPLCQNRLVGGAGFSAESLGAMWSDPRYRERLVAHRKTFANDPYEREARRERMTNWWAVPGRREEQSQRSLDFWADHPELRDEMSERFLALWTDPEYQNAMSEERKARWANREFHAKTSAAIAKALKERDIPPEEREANSKRMHAQRADPKFRAKLSDAVAESNTRRTYTSEMRAAAGERSRERWRDREYADHMKEGNRTKATEQWARPGAKELMSERIREGKRKARERREV
jgi:hypothetical protein